MSGLIDVDAFIADARMAGLDTAEKVLFALSHQPTIEPKQGEWELRGRVHRCSECGNFLDFHGVNAGRGDANFCPNCGANMRKGADDE